MFKTVSKPLNVRSGMPDTEASIPSFLEPGAIVEVTDIVKGRMIDGNDKWYKGRDGNFYWSGGFDNTVSDSALIIEQEDPATRLINYNDLLEGVDSTLKGGRGAGINIAILDSGINRGHKDLQHLQLVSSLNCTGEGDSNNTADQTTDGHGTHIAGLIAALAADKGITGLAPKANIHIYKVIRDNNSCRGEHVAGALQDLLNKIKTSNTPFVVNMSFDIPGMDYIQIKDLLTDISSRCICVAAVGDDELLLDDPTVSLHAPALHPGFIAVGSVGQRFCMSNPAPAFNKRLDFLFPAYSFASCSNAQPSSYRRLSGSSMATAFTTAAASLLLSQSPASATNVQAVKQKLAQLAVNYNNSLFNHFKLIKPTQI